MGLLDGKTLAATLEIGAVQGRVTPPLLLGDNPAGQQIRLDDELLVVAGGKKDVLLFQSKVKVEHPAGTAVLIAGEAAVSASAEDALAPFSQVGGEQTIRRLGPYRVEFNDVDAGLTLSGSDEVGKVRVGLPIAADTVIVAAWAVLVTNFNNLGTNQFMSIDLYGPHAGGADTPGVFGENIYQMDPSGGSYGDEGGASGYGVGIAQGPAVAAGRWNRGPMPVICYDEVTLVVKWGGTTPGTPTTGEADIYALISEPVA